MAPSQRWEDYGRPGSAGDAYSPNSLNARWHERDMAAGKLSADHSMVRGAILKGRQGGPHTGLERIGKAERRYGPLLRGVGMAS